jgi:hypothetical protein
MASSAWTGGPEVITSVVQAVQLESRLSSLALLWHPGIEVQECGRQRIGASRRPKGNSPTIAKPVCFDYLLT